MKSSFFFFILLPVEFFISWEVERHFEERKLFEISSVELSPQDHLAGSRLN